MHFVLLRDRPTVCRGHVPHLRKLLLPGKGGKNTVKPPVSNGSDQQGAYFSCTPSSVNAGSSPQSHVHKIQCSSKEITKHKQFSIKVQALEGLMPSTAGTPV